MSKIARCSICESRGNFFGRQRQNLCERHAFAEARSTVEDFALMLKHFAAGTLRWEEFPASIAREGELCFNELRHFTRLDKDGVPILPGVLRERLMVMGVPRT